MKNKENKVPTIVLILTILFIILAWVFFIWPSLNVATY